MKINIFKKKNSFKKKGSEIDADFYWKIILYVTFVLVVFGASFGFYMFTRVNKETELSPDVTRGEIGTVKKDRLEAVLKYFSDREVKSKNVLNSASPIVDPSR